MDMQNSTLITLCWELYEQGMPKSRIAERLGKHRETIHIWIKNVERYGLLPFLERYEQAKKGERKRRQVDPIVKRFVWKIREREFHCCGQKIQYFLEREHGIHLSVVNFIVVVRRYNTSWSVNMVFISRCLRYMRFWQRNTSFVPNGRRTKREDLYQRHLCPGR